MRRVAGLVTGFLLPMLAFSEPLAKKEKKAEPMETHVVTIKGKPVAFTMQQVISAEKIQERVKELGKTLSEKFTGKQPVVIGVLSGSSIFHSDLVRAMNIPVEVDFVRVSSYHGTESSGKVKSALGVKSDLKGRHIIMVEDIVDTGRTMDFLITHFKTYQPASITIVSLLTKPTKLLPEYKNTVFVDYIGFKIPPDFVVGFGLDLDGYFRNLPDIKIVKTIDGKSV